MTTVFVAYASGNDYQREIIEKACKAASNPSRKVTPWSQQDTSGAPIGNSVEGWIDSADAFIGDISLVNDNVTYELGYAIGRGKPTRLIRSTYTQFRPVQDIGLLDTLGHDSYDLGQSLTRILSKMDETTKWTEVTKNKDQPLFLMQPTGPGETAGLVLSAVKKIARIRFRNFNSAEISRLNASEAYQHVASSFGIIAFWMDGTSEEAIRNNQRAAFIYGIARGKEIPALLIAHERMRLPLDLQDQANRFFKPSDLDELVASFRIRVADAQNDFVTPNPHNERLLETITCGDPVAENEASTLADHFLQTDGYNRTLAGEVNILVGRKGSGKTAVFLQVRDRSRANKDNIVVDLTPDGHQLIKMKEFILDKLSFGTRKEVISAFWEYVLWLEIAYKLLEKDETRALRDDRLLPGYRKLKALFEERVDTGSGDFSERLKRLSDNVLERFRAAGFGDDDLGQVSSSKILEAIYGQDLRELRDGVLDYLRLKGFVYFLFDNLDRFWTPGGFTQDDALIVLGLAESMQEISRKFKRRQLDFRWAIFVRSDVYEFLIRGMADYGKLSVQSLEWGDRELLKTLFERRLEASVVSLPQTWNEIWRQCSVQMVDGKPVMDFLIDGSLMRPRYLIRLFETARRRAMTFGRARIDEDDYRLALGELGWQVLEDLDREISDLVSNGTDLLFEIVMAREGLTVAKLKYLAAKRIHVDKDIQKLLDVMLWNGSLGVVEGQAPRYIFDCGYKRQYLAAIINTDPNVGLVLHPTLIEAVGHET